MKKFFVIFLFLASGIIFHACKQDSKKDSSSAAKNCPSPTPYNAYPTATPYYGQQNGTMGMTAQSILQNRCATSGCHVAGNTRGLADFNIESNASSRGGVIIQRTSLTPGSSQFMPQPLQGQQAVALTVDEKNVLQTWQSRNFTQWALATASNSSNSVYPTPTPYYRNPNCP